jgi:effector-binding domain-containing protein
LRVAAAVGVAPGFGHENLGPVFEQLVPKVLARLDASGVRPTMMVAWYEQPTDEGEVVAHVGFDIGDQAVEDQALTGEDRVAVVDLPVVDVASLVHKGSMGNIEDTYLALVSWIEDSGYRLAGRSRELYLEWNEGDASRNITELQMPIAR